MALCRRLGERHTLAAAASASVSASVCAKSRVSCTDQMDTLHATARGQFIVECLSCNEYSQKMGSNQLYSYFTVGLLLRMLYFPPVSVLFYELLAHKTDQL